jgi:hypothetical protein
MHGFGKSASKAAGRTVVSVVASVELGTVVTLELGAGDVLGVVGLLGVAGVPGAGYRYSGTPGPCGDTGPPGICG